MMGNSCVSIVSTPSFVAYYRVSTQRQGRSGLGLAAQKHAVEDYARRMKKTITGSFKEIESGRRPNRPKLKEALALCRESGAVLVVAKLDRLARDVNLILSLVDSGVPITFLDLPDLSADPIVGRLVLTIMAAIAEFESRRIGQRIKEAMARRREKLEAKHKRLTRRRLSRKHQREASAAWHRWNRKQMKTFRSEFQPLALGLRQSRTLAEVAAEMNARGIATRRRRKWTPGLVHALLR